MRNGAGPGLASGVGSLGGGVGDSAGRVAVPGGVGEGGGGDRLGGVSGVLVAVLDVVAGSKLSLGVRVAKDSVGVTVWISAGLAAGNVSGGLVGEGEPVQL